MVDRVAMERSTFNVGQVDKMYEDFENDFKSVEAIVADVS